MAETKKAAKKDTSENPKLRIRVQAYEPKTLDSSVRQIIETAERFGKKFTGPVPLPTNIKKYSVNRASFIFKKSQEQFEMRTHTRLLDILEPSQELIEALSNLSLPAGVSIEVQMIS